MGRASGLIWDRPASRHLSEGRQESQEKLRSVCGPKSEFWTSQAGNRLDRSYEYITGMVRDLALRHRMQTGSESHLISHPVDTRLPFPGDEIVRALS
jgi:hypothetical protein